MFFPRVAVPAVLAALLSTANAQTSTGGLSIQVPGGDSLWWIASSINTLAWTCKTSTFTNFTVLIGNTSPTVLATPQAFIAQEDNFVCSQLITADQISQGPATGYFIQLADPFNSTNIYAQSAEFEIKAVGSAYPPASATPSGVPGAAAASTSSSASGSSSGSSGAPSSTSSGASSGSPSPTTSKSSAADMKATLPGLVAVAAAALGIAFA